MGEENAQKDVVGSRGNTLEKNLDEDKAKRERGKYQSDENNRRKAGEGKDLLQIQDHKAPALYQ